MNGFFTFKEKVTEKGTDGFFLGYKHLIASLSAICSDSPVKAVASYAAGSLH